MILLYGFSGFTLPLSNPVVQFLVILMVILLSPIILNRLKIPHLLGLIIAGALIGPKGFGLLERDSSIILSGTAGLLYIMFLAGLELDIREFKKNSSKSMIFGMYTFLIPMTIGTIAGFYVLDFSLKSSVLLASMFASHTLIAYPLISNMGIAKNRAVNVAVGGTMITDTLALLVLAVIVGMTTGEVNSAFWIRLSLSILIFGVLVLYLFPIIGRWFFKRYHDNVTQYIFVLFMVFLGAVMAQIAGVEAIIGAFLAGLALNRLIPHTSPLMNRIDFVGNAIFIPFFLISVGMLVDYRAFFKDVETLKVSLVMVVVASTAKYAAAWLAQKTFGYTVDERRLIYGLSNAQAAATLAAVLVGYNIILGVDEQGEPIRLLSESVLNGSIVMILFTCTLSTFVAQKGAKNIALLEKTNSESNDVISQEKILIPLSNYDTAEELVNLGILVKSKKNKSGLYAINIIRSESEDESSETYARKILEKAAKIAASTDNYLHELIRYDNNIVNGISGAVKENKITDLILGLHVQKGFSDTFLGNLTEGILTKCNTTTLIYKPAQPFGTIKRHLVVVPPHAEKEIGFPFWLIKIWNMARNSGARLVFYGTEQTLKFIRELAARHPIEAQFVLFDDWDDFLNLSKEIQPDDNLIIILSRKDKPSYHSHMTRIPHYLNNYFANRSFILIYPMQLGVTESSEMDLKSATLLEPIEKLDEIGKTIAKLLKGR